MRKVYIETSVDKVEAAICENGCLEHFYSLKKTQIAGNIYIGKVLNVNKNIGIFVDIGEEKSGLLEYRDNLHTGDAVTVQVSRDAVGEKGCQLTEEITIAGRFIIINGKGYSGCSRRLSGERRKEGLRIITALCTSNTDINFGITLRTSFEYASSDEVIKEAEKLKEIYAQIISKTKNRYNVCLVYRAEPLDIAKNFAVSDEEIEYSFNKIQNQIAGIFSRGIIINGIKLVFDKTEAMTVIDVNIGNFPLKFKDADTANTEANLIAAKEIARQIRLRNIGGNILVDFISVKNAENKQKVLTVLKNECEKDNVKCFFDYIDSLFIVSINRLIRY